MINCRPGVGRALEEFKISVYGENYDEESERGDVKPTEASRKRKAIAEHAAKECENYDWGELADTGKVNLRVAAFIAVHLFEKSVKLGYRRGSA